MSASVRSPLPRQEPEPVAKWPWVSATPTMLIQAAAFGLVFGFLLQKGGVAKFDILIGALLLENFVVMKVMLSAIVVGMVGVHLLERAGVLEFRIKETVYGSAVIGGLIFGIGFALIAYCPGTGAVAMGQGNLDAIVGFLGLILGSYLFALTSSFTKRTVESWGKNGNLTLPDVAGMNRGTFVAFAAPALIGVLVLLEIFTQD